MVKVAVVIGFAAFVDLLVYGIIIPVLPDLIQNCSAITLSSTQLAKQSSYLFAAYAIGLFLATPFAAIVSDFSQSRKLPMIAGLVCLILALIMFVFSKTFWLLFVSRFAQGAAAAMTWVVGYAILAEEVPYAQLGLVTGVVFGCNLLGYVLGPWLGGITAYYFDIQTPFYVCIGFVTLALVLRIMFVTSNEAAHLAPTVPDSSSSESSCSQNEDSSIEILTAAPESRKQQQLSKKKQFVINLKACLKMPAFWLTISGTSLGAGALSCIESFASTVMQARYGMSLLTVSFSLLCALVPMALINILVGKLADTTGHLNLMLFGVVASAVSMVFFGFAMESSLWLFLTSLVIAGLAAPFSLGAQFPGFAQIAKRVSFETGSQPAFGLVYAFANSSFSIGMIIFPIFVAEIWNRAAHWIGFVTFACICVLHVIGHIKYGRHWNNSQHYQEAATSVVRI